MLSLHGFLNEIPSGTKLGSKIPSVPSCLFSCESQDALST